MVDTPFYSTLDEIHIEAQYTPQMTLSSGSQRRFFRATTSVKVATDMGTQELHLGANGSTTEKAVQHLQNLVEKAVNAIQQAAEIPNA